MLGLEAFSFLLSTESMGEGGRQVILVCQEQILIMGSLSWSIFTLVYWFSICVAGETDWGVGGGAENENSKDGKVTARDSRMPAWLFCWMETVPPLGQEHTLRVDACPVWSWLSTSPIGTE